MPSRLTYALLSSAALACALLLPSLTGAAPSEPVPAPSLVGAVATQVDTSSGIREAAWAPDGRRIAISWHDLLWTMTPSGGDRRRLIAQSAGWLAERDPAYSPDGKWLAFAAETKGEFDLWVVPANGGTPLRVTSEPGDERWPSWTRDDRVVYSHRGADRGWQLYATTATSKSPPTRLTPDDTEEWQGRVSPDGKLVAFVSNRESESGEADLWLRQLSGPASGVAQTLRLTTSIGSERFPTWAPDNARVAYALGLGSQAAIWAVPVPAFPPPGAASASGRGAAGGRGAGGALPNQGGRGGRGGVVDPFDAPVLASRHGGVPAWSPDGEQLLIAAFSPTDPGYNGDPLRNDDDAPLLFTSADQYTLWRVPAPRRVDAGALALSALKTTPQASSLAAFDRVWQTVQSLYYRTGEGASAWEALRQKYRPLAAAAASPTVAEDVIDAMVAEQPMIKRGAISSRAVVTSGNPLASAAGAEILAKGGNIVDAAIAVDFALGVVEPDASSIGGDGMALLFLKGMTGPVAIDFKDMTPGHATNDNPKLFTAAGARTATDGPSVANIPGIVAGMDLLFTKYGSKKVSWADVLAPAIRLAEEGFILDEALPTTIAEGRASFAKYPESAKLFLPGGRVPRPGERFMNRDYAATLRLIATEGAQTFYRGTLARKIADDFAANGGVMTVEDLAQYRAIERVPLRGEYRGHLVFSAPPPVSNGAQMIETLQILDQYRPKPNATPSTDADFLHYFIEAWKIRDGGVRIADPDRWPIDLGNHLDMAHAVDRFKLLRRDSVYVAPPAAGGRGGGGTTPLPDDHEDPTRRIGTGTTSFALADVDGNMIVFTQTLSTWGGNYYVSKGLGFLYNDHFRGGRGGTGYGAMLPLQRSSSTSVPTMLFAPSRAGEPAYGIAGFTPRMAVGAAGNSWIPASVYSIIANVIDGGLDAQHAIEAPRMLIGGGRGGTQIEDRIPRSILADAMRRGQTFTKIGRKGEVRQGYASVVLFNSLSKRVEAGAEPRRSHGAVGVGQ